MTQKQQRSFDIKPRPVAIRAWNDITKTMITDFTNPNQLQYVGHGEDIGKYTTKLKCNQNGSIIVEALVIRPGDIKYRHSHNLPIMASTNTAAFDETSSKQSVIFDMDFINIHNTKTNTNHIGLIRHIINSNSVPMSYDIEMIEESPYEDTTFSDLYKDPDLTLTIVGNVYTRRDLLKQLTEYAK